MRGGMSSGHVDSLLVSWWKADMYAEKEKIRTASQKKTTTATINKQVKGGEMTYVCHFVEQSLPEVSALQECHKHMHTSSAY